MHTARSGAVARPGGSKGVAAAAVPHRPQSSLAACSSSACRACQHLDACVNTQACPSSRALVPQTRLQPWQQQQQQRPGRSLQPPRAGPVDAAPAWTLDQIAGLVFGAAMLAFYFSANFVDVYIAKQQRKQLGLCERCGGLNEPATCSQEGCPMRSKAMQ